MTQEKYLERFNQVTEYLNTLTARKNSDYAGENNAFQNFNLIEILTSGKISTSAGILVRITDKVQRIANLLAKPPAVVEEAIEDSLLDLAVYSIIEYLWLTSGKEVLPLPGNSTVAQEPIAAQEEPVYEELPDGVSANTMDEAFTLLSGKVEKSGAASLTPSENFFLKMIISAKQALLDNGRAE